MAGPALPAGPGPESALEVAAAEALRLAALDPTASRLLSRAVLDDARLAGRWDVVSTAERALGVAAMSVSELDLAVGSLRNAVRAGQRAGLSRCTGEARMSLASALVLRGRPAQARREIEAAIGELDGLAGARAGVQRAAILQELGRDDEALEGVRRALPVLRRAGDVEWATRALSNRSLIHVARRSFAAAELDLREATRLCEEHDLELPAAYAEQNLGWVRVQCGDVPAALRHFDAAQARYHRLGVVHGPLLLDRAEVLLSVRLLDEARDTAQAAVSAFEHQLRGAHLPEAQLLLSTVALVQGDPTAALAAAGAAASAFRRLGRTRSLTLARYAQLQARVVASPGGITPAQAARAADELAAAGWAVPALEARVLAGRLALARGNRPAARRHLALASRARLAGPADARARAWLAEALLRRADGRRSGALAALCAGLRVVEEHQATLGATELRAHVSVHRGELARSGLEMALEDGNARRALWWAERNRATALLQRLAQPPADPALAADLADLRATMAELEQTRDAGQLGGTLVQRQVRLERRIRDRCRTLGGGSRDRQGRAQPVAELIAPLGDAALVEYLELDGVLRAVTVAGGKVRLHELGQLAGVQESLGYVPFALRRLGNPRTGSASRAAAAAMLQRAASALDANLLAPLRGALQDRPLVVVPTGVLQSLPWSILPSCAGRPVTVSPSATLWHQATTRPGPPLAAPVVVVAGPGLPGATLEAATIAALYPGSVRLFGAAATAPALSAAADGAALLHLAAHGSLRSDNPSFSSLLLADGPFTVYDLERLRRPPQHVVLAACDTGRAHTVAGDEILGFGAALLSGGTATLVAPVVPVPDGETVPLMRAYHRALLAGRSPAAALAAAQADSSAQDGVGWAAAAGFVCLGAGLVEPPAIG